ncbi:MAG TPA: trypsin-like peptidase domain-containing protein [Phycisphaerales bacterium]
MKTSLPRLISVAVIASLAGAAGPCTALAAEPATLSAAQDLQSARSLSRAFNRVAKNVEPAVVHITAVRRVPELASDGWFTRRTGKVIEQAVGFGSGVIVDPSGVILTNNHVVEPAETLVIKLNDGREYKGNIVGRDPLTDLAVVRLKDVDAAEKLPTVPFGDSDALEVGDWVVAIGSPFGFTNTVTSGIVSAKSRAGVRLPGANADMVQDFIQTDAAINPGNSGGPLLDLDGKLVGINSAIATRAGGSEGIGFAIPTHIARGVMDSILKSGRVVRGWVGLMPADITPARLRQLGVTQEGGVLVQGVDEDSPAARAGIKTDDIILRVNGRPLTKESSFRATMAVTPPGSKAIFDVLREGKPQSLTVEVGERNASIAASLGGLYIDRFGGIVRTIDNQIRKELGRGMSRVSGVIVLSTDPEGRAATGGFEPRDIIVAVDGEPVKTAEEFLKRLEAADLKEGIRLDVIRERMRGHIELRDE